LLLFARFDDTLISMTPIPRFCSCARPFRRSRRDEHLVAKPRVLQPRLREQAHRLFAELQQIWQGEKLGLIGGGRFQTATADTRDNLNRIPPLGIPNQVLGNNDTDLRRYSVTATPIMIAGFAQAHRGRQL